MITSCRDLKDALMMHRFGELRPAYVTVVVMGLFKHRQAAFDDANFMMDYLKSAPHVGKRKPAVNGSKHGVRMKMHSRGGVTKI